MSAATTTHLASQLRIAIGALFVFCGTLTLACAGQPDAPPAAVHVLTADGSVNPVMDRYIRRGIEAAEDKDATAVVIRLDTPGGLSSSMDDIIQRILAADVPVIVYVTPSGGQAASAGTFITYAAHVAAMAPGTVIGSATPINATGDDIGGDLRNKVIENAVAKARGLAVLRGRNADWAEDAVRHGISSESSEALQLGVVDMVVRDLDELLESTDGLRVVVEPERSVTIRTARAPVVYNDRNFIEDFLNVIADPNIAFLLLSLGSLALFIEIVNPGQIFPGVFGVISLLTGFFALSVLPFNWAGVALILVAFVLFGLEMFITSHGVLGVGGAVSLLLGGLLLTSDNPPEFQVSRWLVIGMAGTLGAFVLFIVVNIVRIRTMPAQVGVETMIGQRAVARSLLNPNGFVVMDGEIWSAEADEPIPLGESVVVTEVQGLKLKVKRSPQEGAQ